MTYALDTNIISFLLRPSQNQDVVGRFEKAIEQGASYVIPPICFYEISWYLQRKAAKAQLKVLESLYRNSAAKLNMGEAEFVLAAKIKAQLENQGTPIGAKDADIFIAAYCIVNDCTLITDNTKDFERIEGLNCANWKG